MVKFKQKEFGKIRKIVNYIKDHPILPLSAASLGVGIANYTTNTKRTKEAKEYNKAQLEAIKTLNKNIVDNSNKLNNLSNTISNKDKQLSRETVNNTYLDHPSKPRIRILRIFKREKDFSIQSGGFKGRKVEPSGGGYLTGTIAGAGLGALFGSTIGHSDHTSSTGGMATIGALLGAGVGALAVWLSNSAEKSIFNSGLSHRANSYTIIKGLENYYMPSEKDTTVEEEITERYGNIKRTVRTSSKPNKTSVSPVGTLFSVDSDPKKHTVNALLRCNVLVMLVNNPTNMELTKLNNALDSYCKSYSKADYTSQKLDKNSYLVEVNIVSGAEINPLVSMINSGIKINILTTDRFGIKNK